MRGVSTRDLAHPKPRHPQGTFATVGSLEVEAVPEPCHTECGPRASSTHHPWGLVRNAGPWAPPRPTKQNLPFNRHPSELPTLKYEVPTLEPRL